MNLSSDNSDLSQIEHIVRETSLKLIYGYVQHPNGIELARNAIIRMEREFEIVSTAVQNGIRSSLNNIDDISDALNKIKKYNVKFPEYVYVNDSEKCIEFLSRLSKDEYSYIEVAKLLKAAGISITRQTIGTHYRNGRFGTNETKGKKRISKQGLYTYFRSLIDKR